MTDVLGFDSARLLSSSAMNSAARDYTVCLIQIFEEAFPEAPLDHKNKIIKPAKGFGIDVINELRSSVAALARDSLARRAISDLENYGKQPEPSSQYINIQTVGVGYADDYDMFLKLGFILGDRVVMWDNMVVGAVLAPQPQFDITEVLKTAYRLFSLRSIAEKGGLAILPHPTVWNPRASRRVREILDIPGVTPNLIGLVHSRVLLEDKFTIHPYCWSDSVTEAQRQVAMGDDPHLTAEKQRTQRNLQDTITHKELAFATGLSPAAFYDVVATQRDFKRLLAKKLDSYGGAKTDPERFNHLTGVRNEIIRDIAAYHKRLRRLHYLKATGFAITGISATLGVINGPQGLAAMLTALGSGAATLGVAAATALLEIDKDNRDFKDNAVIYRIFSRLSKAREHELKTRVLTEGRD